MVFDFEQASLYLGKVSQDNSLTKSSFILVKDLKATEVLEVIPSSEFISAKMLDFTDNNGRYDRMKMEVTTMPGLPLGRINETITVKTNLPDKPTAVLRLSGSVIGDVEVSPEWMTFVVTDSGSSRQSTLTKKIFITNHVEGARLEIVDIQDSEGHLDIDIKPLSEGKKFELTATLKEEAIPEQGTISGNVVLTTNFPSQKEVAIRYSAVHKSYGRGGAKTDKKNYSGKKTSGTTSAARRDGQPPIKKLAGDGVFAPGKNDPFAVGGALNVEGADEKEKEKAKGQPAQAKKKLSSQKEAEEKPPADDGTDGDADKKEEQEEAKSKH